MGSNQDIGQVTIETRTWDRWDFPNEFKVEVSTNGTTWTKVAEGVGFGWKRPITFDAVTARYVKITQTGTAPEWWTIGELNIYEAP